MALSASHPRLRYLLAIALVAGGYFLLAVFALDPPWIDGDLGKLFWPASGFGLAMLLLGGIDLWPGVAIGAFVSTYFTSGPLVHSLATAAGNGIEVLSGAYLLRRCGFSNRMQRTRDVVALLLCGGVVGVCISAAFGTFGLRTSGLAPAAAVYRIWWKWALSHAMGIAVVTPFVLTLSSWWEEPRRRWSSVEASILFLLLVLVGAVSFWGGTSIYSLEYLPFPLLVWAAFRFRLPGAAAANLVTSGMAVWGTVSGSGPFALGSSSEDTLLTWSFVNVSAITTLLLAAVTAEGKRAEEERRKSESRYRMLIEQAADGVFLADASGHCTDVNSRACDMLGVDREAILRMDLRDLVAPDDRERVTATVEHLAPGTAVISNWRVRRSDGATFPAEVSAKRLEDGRIQAFVRDVTERLALEDQLSQSQKMEAVGLLAGGIAHDFNNLLTAIIGHSDFALTLLPEDHRVRADIVEVSKAACRAADLTKKLLAFARKQIVEPKVVALPDLLENLENMLDRVLGENIELTMRTAGEPWRVKVDPVQLEQVILNITINARDAMPNGGRLVLECGSVHWRAEDNRSEMDMAPGDYATLTVTDSGVGMDAETLARVFEPFYTTKDRSQGTGLGLAVSYGIVKQAGGYIWATSERGRGSTFRIFLPRAEDAEAMTQESATAPVQADDAQGGESILLIEDEPLVRDLAVDILRGRGYRVLTARDGEEALAIARSYPLEIHLTVTDIVLPAMSGKEVARRLRETRPDLEVLFMSGYAEEQVVHHGIVDLDVSFLAKPFTPAVLTDKVRSVLDRRRVRTRLGGSAAESEGSSARSRARLQAESPSGSERGAAR